MLVRKLFSVPFTTMFEESCVICGDQVKSSRLGCPACLSCMIFFRRSVIKEANYRCAKQMACPVYYEFRSSCRHCRYQKCFQAGMRSDLVVTRDTVGPRSPPPAILEVPEVLMEQLVALQTRQLEDHEEVPEPRGATVTDVNLMFKWSFKDSVEWASQFEPFLRLSNEEQKCVISEFGVGFLVVDQGFRSARDWRKGTWTLQNGSFLEASENLELVEQDFIIYLENSIKRQFQIMQIDEFEIAVLKTLMLFSNSFPKQNIFSEYQEKIDKLRNKCLTELMTYLSSKYPTSHDTRFGKLLLFIGDIRSAVKAVYNQTKVSALFDISKFDKFPLFILSKRAARLVQYHLNKQKVFLTFIDNKQIRLHMDEELEDAVYLFIRSFEELGEEFTYKKLPTYNIYYQIESLKVFLILGGQKELQDTSEYFLNVLNNPIICLKSGCYGRNAKEMVNFLKSWKDVTSIEIIGEVEIPLKYIMNNCRGVKNLIVEGHTEQPFDYRNHSQMPFSWETAFLSLPTGLTFDTIKMFMNCKRLRLEGRSYSQEEVRRILDAWVDGSPLKHLDIEIHNASINLLGMDEVEKVHNVKVKAFFEFRPLWFFHTAYLIEQKTSGTKAVLIIERKYVLLSTEYQVGVENEYQ
uniref:Nuclear receptor domain-containing protein n=2 Tax=Caenorhabditis tropicalis TaxID=1561998 RepID=A0A1I7UTH0_9PELO